MINKLSIFLLLFLLLSGCEDVSERKWFEHKEDAIIQGLQDGNYTEIQRLMVGNETLVLYKLNAVDASEAIGVGSVTQSELGYSWYRGSHHVKAPLLIFDYKTESNIVIPLTIGRVEDKLATSIVLEGKTQNYKLEVVNGYFIGAYID